MKIISVVGARPNFMKIAPIHRKIAQNYSGQIDHLICHTGQHYDEKMSSIFFEELDLPRPHFYLGVGSGTHAQQTAKIMIEFEKILIQEKPNIVVVVGDVNSTIACSLTAAKLNISVAHVEAGLRSFDRTMPEEINRILTDNISDYLFVTEQSGLSNLKKEGIDDSKVFFVGNVMIDSLLNFMPKIDKSNIMKILNVRFQEYVLITFHRPSNVDDKNKLIDLINFLNDISKKIRVIFPVHPRTKYNLDSFGLRSNVSDNITLTDPLGYIDFLCLTKNAKLVLTDSGGIQEETTFLNIPCITLRNSTERPVTVDLGTNFLVGDHFEKAKEIFVKVVSGIKKESKIPELWDGKSAERIVQILASKK